MTVQGVWRSHQKGLQCWKSNYIFGNFSSLSTNSTRKKFWTVTYKYGQVTLLYSWNSSCNAKKNRHNTLIGSLQVCVWQESGSESIIHAMHAIYEDQTCEAVLLVDLSNANNSIKKKWTKMAICVKTVTHSWLSIIGATKSDYVKKQLKAIQLQ